MNTMILHNWKTTHNSIKSILLTKLQNRLFITNKWRRSPTWVIKEWITPWSMAKQTLRFSMTLFTDHRGFITIYLQRIVHHTWVTIGCKLRNWTRNHPETSKNQIWTFSNSISKDDNDKEWVKTTALITNQTTRESNMTT
jgi:hypothetical protein